jgi:hypothetical protein
VLHDLVDGESLLGGDQEFADEVLDLLGEPLGLGN